MLTIHNILFDNVLVFTCEIRAIKGNKVGDKRDK